MAAGISEVGQLVRVRDRAWAVADVRASSTLHGELPEVRKDLLELTSVGHDGLDDDLAVIWEIEPGATILETAILPRPRLDHFDDPSQLDAFLDVAQWAKGAPAYNALLVAWPEFARPAAGAFPSSPVKEGML